jgi:hypothetical protein
LILFSWLFNFTLNWATNCWRTIYFSWANRDSLLFRFFSNYYPRFRACRKLSNAFFNKIINNQWLILLANILRFFFFCLLV